MNVLIDEFIQAEVRMKRLCRAIICSVLAVFWLITSLHAGEPNKAKNEYVIDRYDFTWYVNGYKSAFFITDDEKKEHPTITAYFSDGYNKHNRYYSPIQMEAIASELKNTENVYNELKFGGTRVTKEVKIETHKIEYIWEKGDKFRVLMIDSKSRGILSFDKEKAIETAKAYGDTRSIIEFFDKKLKFDTNDNQTNAEKSDIIDNGEYTFIWWIIDIDRRDRVGILKKNKKPACVAIPGSRFRPDVKFSGEEAETLANELFNTDKMYDEIKQTGEDVKKEVICGNIRVTYRWNLNTEFTIELKKDNSSYTQAVLTKSAANEFAKNFKNATGMLEFIDRKIDF